MFGKLKSLFGIKSEEAASTGPASKPATPTAQPATPSAPPEARPRIPANASGESIEISLAAITDSLSVELKSAIAKAPGKQSLIKLPLSWVVEQLSKGAVKFTFGELRQLSPPGTFAENPQFDAATVSVPMAEVLPKIKSSQIQRRANQKTIDIPNDIKPVFGTATDKSEPPQKPHAPAAATAPTPAAAPAPKPAAPQTPVPSAPAAPETAPIKSMAGLSDPTKLAAGSPPAPTPIKPLSPLPVPATPKAPAPLPTSSAPPAAPKPSAPVPAPAPAAPAAAPAFVSTLVGDLKFPLATVLESLPEPIKSALAGSTGEVVIPLATLEPLMRKGKVTFAWSQLRSYLQPAVPASTAAAADESPVDLPLKSIIPLFLAASKPTTTQKKVTVAENIPDVFAAKMGAATAAAAAPAAPAPAAPESKPAAPASAPAAEPAVSSALGAALGQPAKAQWTPAEVVAAIAGMPGVGGCMIAMNDGLKVADKLDAGINTDAFAGFLADLSARTVKYTHELKLGDATSFKVQLKDRQIVIFPAGKIFLAILGAAGQPVAEEKLAVVAKEFASQSR